VCVCVCVSVPMCLDNNLWSKWPLTYHTAFMDYCPGRFFWATRFLFLVFRLSFPFGERIVTNLRYADDIILLERNKCWRDAFEIQEAQLTHRDRAKRYISKFALFHKVWELERFQQQKWPSRSSKGIGNGAIHFNRPHAIS